MNIIYIYIHVHLHGPRTVKLTILFTSINLGIMVSASRKESGDDSSSYGNLILIVGAVIIVNCGFQGLLDLQNHLHNPFG
jgi:hypothetical protein